MGIKVNRQAVIHTGRVFKLISENITMPNGNVTDIELIQHPGAASIVAIDRTNRIILIKQYRHALGSFIWEIPAGTIDGRETPLACARRELAEETGYQADSWLKLGEITPVPGYSDERIHIFLAASLQPGFQKLDSDELLDVCPYAVNHILKMIEKGEIQDAKTIIGIQFALQYLNQLR
ncbi:MAG: NUDIX hydrolase [Desulfobacterales bacterium]|nr:NUDIX hydrolase [Desulfobacterales bacterium]